MILPDRMILTSVRHLQDRQVHAPQSFAPGILLKKGVGPESLPDGPSGEFR